EVRIQDGAGYYDETGAFSLSEVWVPVTVAGGAWAMPFSGMLGDGAYQARARVTDGAGRSSFVDAIFDIDQFGPTCGTCIETTAPRAPWTNTVNVDLLLDATDPHGPIDVQLSGDVVTPGTFALASPMAVELTAGDGTKTVFVEYL